MKHNRNDLDDRSRYLRSILAESLTRSRALRPEQRIALYNKARNTLDAHFATCSTTDQQNQLTFQKQALELAIADIEAALGRSPPPAQVALDETVRPISRDISDAIKKAAKDSEALFRAKNLARRAPSWVSKSPYGGALALISLVLGCAYLAFRSDVNITIGSALEAITQSEDQVTVPTAQSITQTAQRTPEFVARALQETVAIRMPAKMTTIAPEIGTLTLASATDPTTYRAEFTSLAIALEWQTALPGDTNIAHILNLVIERSEERIFTVGMLEVWSPQQSAFRTLKGTPVRIGLNRVVYGVSETLELDRLSHPALGDIILARFSVRFESGNTNTVILPIQRLKQ